MAITVKLMGGIGNTMFQYAMGLAQARRLDVELVLDVSLLGGKRKYQLDQWEFKGKPPSLVTGHRTTIAGGMPYNQEIVDRIKNGDVLEGHWQTEKYFLDVRDELRDVFIPKNLDRTSLKKNSIAVHIRRGDYLNSSTKEFHGLLPMKYYQTAMAYISERVPNPKFFVFSDDFEWIKQTFVEALSLSYLLLPAMLPTMRMMN